MNERDLVMKFIDKIIVDNVILFVLIHVCSKIDISGELTNKLVNINNRYENRIVHTHLDTFIKDPIICDIVTKITDDMVGHIFKGDVSLEEYRDHNVVVRVLEERVDYSNLKKMIDKMHNGSPDFGVLKETTHVNSMSNDMFFKMRDGTLYVFDPTQKIYHHTL